MKEILWTLQLDAFRRGEHSTMNFVEDRRRPEPDYTVEQAYVDLVELNREFEGRKSFVVHVLKKLEQAAGKRGKYNHLDGGAGSIGRSIESVSQYSTSEAIKELKELMRW